jgi:hypothetical protein
MPVGLLFAALTAVVVYMFWRTPDSNFGLYAAIVIAIIMAVLVFLVQGKRFAGRRLATKSRNARLQLRLRKRLLRPLAGNRTSKA